MRGIPWLLIEDNIRTGRMRYDTLIGNAIPNINNIHLLVCEETIFFIYQCVYINFLVLKIQWTGIHENNRMICIGLR